MSEAHPVFDPERLEELYAIGVMTPDFFALLSESFGRASRESIATIEQACEAMDHNALCRAAHALKGSAATFGAQQLASRAAEFEECGRSGSALPPIESVANLRSLADAASILARDWASTKGLTPAPTPAV